MVQARSRRRARAVPRRQSSVSAAARRIARRVSTALALAAVGLGAAGTAAAVELKLATVAPDGSHWMREMRAAAAEIKERTDGRVEIQFYPGGVMGNDAQVLRKIRIGQLQGGAFTAGGLAERYPGLNLYGIPLLFRSLDEVDYVRSRMDETLRHGLLEAGFVSFGFVEGGFAHLMANEPIRSIEDMRRRKVWVPEGDRISFLAMERLGLSPVVLPVTDVLTGLQTGLLDIVAASPVAALVLQWHTAVRYMTDLPVSYSMGVVAFDRRAYSRLDAADQRIFAEVVGDTVRRLDEAAREDNRRAREVLESSGVEIVRVEQAGLDDIRATIQSLYPELESRADVDAALLDRLLGLLAEYRRSSSTGK
ncbi:MAG TPA: TRAP transporter substrate-binding protein DctP [Gammaproteobacteria bacterium]